MHTVITRRIKESRKRVFRIFLRKEALWVGFFKRWKQVPQTGGLGMGKPRESEKREEETQVRKDLVRRAHINSKRATTAPANLGTVCVAAQLSLCSWALHLQSGRLCVGILLWKYLHHLLIWSIKQGLRSMSQGSLSP